jgi:hypothetical protein
MSVESRHSSFSAPDSPQTIFTDRIAALLARIECRRADSVEDREAIFRLRYDAYLREGAISPDSSERFADRYDDAANTYLFGLYVDDKLASSMRIQVASKENNASLSLEAFRDVLKPELDAGKIIIDPNRFVADQALSRLNRGLPYATLRLSMVAAQHFGADLVLAAVRVEHQAFYRRAFDQRVICEPRPYPNLTKPLSLMAIHYPTAVNGLWQRYPFIPASLSERRRLFERAPVPASRNDKQPRSPNKSLPQRIASFMGCESAELAGGV